jgi:predicted transcriptional regulator
MSTKRVSVSIPEDMLPLIDAAARRDHRSRSEWIQEALLVHLVRSGTSDIPNTEPLPDEIAAVRRGEDEFARGEFVRLDDVQHDLGLDSQ